MSNRILIADLERRMAGWRAELEQAEAAKTASAWTEPVTGMEFLRVPAGSFWMGQSEAETQALLEEVGQEDYDRYYARELPRHEVDLSEFRLAATPVTNRQFRLWKPEHDSGAYEEHPLNDDEQPVVEVSWDEAQGFIEWLNARTSSIAPAGEFHLPSEAQWEYACRAGTSTARYWGDGEDQAGQYANVADQTKQKAFPDWPEPFFPGEEGYATTSPVRSFRPNAFGLYDMLGNVWEWCRDIYADNAYNQHKRLDPIYATSTGENRVLRGGSWGPLPRYVRCAYRNHRAPSGRYHDIGFRLARTLL